MAVLDAVFLPPAIVYWLFVHPLAPQWRRLGVVRSYVILTAGMTIMAVALYVWRDAVLGRALPTHWALWVVAGAAFLGSQVMEGWCRKYLDFKTLAGVPELRGDQSSRVLLDQGPYAVVRHPRYLAVTLGVLAYAAFVQYTGIYVLTVLALAALVVVIVLEEAELERSLGAAYADYKRRVPMLIPRRGRRARDDR
jgi:protein-S-isoprenylcysteine O-methyltransferase Ste14